MVVVTCDDQKTEKIEMVTHKTFGLLNSILQFKLATECTAEMNRTISKYMYIYIPKADLISKTINHTYKYKRYNALTLLN